MGKPDGYESEILEDNTIFADLVNGILFGGERIVQGNDLQELDSGLVYTDRRQTKKVIRDKSKLWKSTIFTVITVENQNYIDYRMITRVMLAEGMEYDRQWKKLHAAHKKMRDLKERDEKLSGMKAEEKFWPVVTIVVYYGREPWKGPRFLFDQLDFSDKRERLGPYICNHWINLFDYHEFDGFHQFQTELQCLFEILRYAADKKTLSARMKDKEALYKKAGKPMVRLISELTRIKLNYTEGEEEMPDLIKAVQDMIDEGRAEGKAEGKTEALIMACKEFGATFDETAEKLKKLLSFADEEVQENMKLYW